MIPLVSESSGLIIKSSIIVQPRPIANAIGITFVIYPVLLTYSSDQPSVRFLPYRYGVAE